MLGDQRLRLSNLRMCSHVTFAIEVARDVARTDDERAMTERFAAWEEVGCPHEDLDLELRFPSLAEKRFWARIFADVAQRIFLREIGNQDVTSWQAGAIGDAYVTARFLQGAVDDAG
jgi:hypothetical protein